MKSEFPKTFFDYVIKTDSCWLWTGCKNEGGYGVKYFNGKYEVTHRISWSCHEGEIPKGIFVLHKCDVRNCVNPEHLFLGTQRDNVDDMVAKGRNRRPKKGAMLTDDQINEIKKLYTRPMPGMKQNGITQRKLANIYGVSLLEVNYILNNKTYPTKGLG